MTTLLYDPDNPLDTEFGEVPALTAVADLIAGSAGAQSLSAPDGIPTGDAAAKRDLAASKVVEGSHFPSWSNDEFKPDELLTTLAMFQVFSEPQGSMTIIVEGHEVDAAGKFGLIVRRFFSDAWLVDKHNTEQFFTDRINRLAADLANWFQELNTPRLTTIERTGGPSWGPLKLKSANGEYMWAAYTIGWGDPIGGGG